MSSTIEKVLTEKYVYNGKEYSNLQIAVCHATHDMLVNVFSATPLLNEDITLWDIAQKLSENSSCRRRMSSVIDNINAMYVDANN